MSLTDEDRKLLREVVQWRRANGWGFGFYPKRGEADWTSGDGVLVEADFFGYGVQLIVDGGERRRGAFWPRSVREAVDILAALGILPITFSSAYKSGRESALDRMEWRVRIAGYQAPWSENNYSREDAETSLGRALQHYPDAWIEHRRTGATAWVRAL